VAGVSALADGIYLKRLLEAVLMNKGYLELRMDSSAARSILQILQRQGVKNAWCRKRLQSNQCQANRTLLILGRKVTRRRGFNYYLDFLDFKIALEEKRLDIKLEEPNDFRGSYFHSF
jgi:hypothetical protein